MQGKWATIFDIEGQIDSSVGNFVAPSSTTVITGFWRSGTTWLLEAISRASSGKGCFEPFYWHVSDYQPLLYTLKKKLPKDICLNAFMPFNGSSQLHAYVRRALTGAISDQWVRRTRLSLREAKGNSSTSTFINALYRILESMNKNIVVKFVRGHLISASLQDWFQPRILHLRRDPRAVVASFIRHKWDWYQDISLERQLLLPTDGRRSYFLSFAEEIRRLDQRPADERLAAYWTLLELYIEHLNMGMRHRILNFEDICIHGTDYLKDAIGDIFDDVPSPSQLLDNSSTTYGRRGDTSSSKRIWGWKDELTADCLSRLEKVVCTFGGEHLLHL